MSPRLLPDKRGEVNQERKNVEGCRNRMATELLYTGMDSNTTFVDQRILQQCLLLEELVYVSCNGLIL
ncbi:hypothetical protein CEXT_374081 [Caerostris extrusa]|uniref:Uncharacterized protein n=1 Tax=Caerostris extrusa TaxID=172846 RepID=A0AAV4YCT6_CAEEX|nr:hypothetical protein CEXT_374081 [Caerostris extrusa]